MVRILSWNTLESGEGGAWSDGWGCPLEIQRKEELLNSTILGWEDDERTIADAKSKAEKILTEERYKRIRNAVLGEALRSGGETLDFLLFQECTVGDFWDEPPPQLRNNNPITGDSLDNEFFEVFGSLYEKLPCYDDDSNEDNNSTPETVQHLYFRKNSGWVPVFSVRLHSKALAGGCLAEFVRCENSEPNCSNANASESLVLVNLHGKSRDMRDPDLRNEGISDLWESIGAHFVDDDSWKNRIILCGDWNTQLSDLIDPFRNANSDGVLEPIAGLLDNATATDGYPFFSTNHEDGFLGQYDGCLFFGTPPVQGSSPSYLELKDTSWNMTGFMPKGKDGKLSGDHPEEAIMYNNFTYHHTTNESNNTEEGVYLNGIFLPGSTPSMGLSDHLRIYTTIHINRNSRDDTTVNDGENLLPQLRQRRPYRDWDDNYS